jgi:hypothetical protein
VIGVGPSPLTASTIVDCRAIYDVDFFVRRISSYPKRVFQQYPARTVIRGSLPERQQPRALPPFNRVRRKDPGRRI